MNSLDLIRKFHSTLPTVREWIEKTLEENKTHAVPVIDLAFPRLEKVFPLDLLSKAKVVVVTGKVPFPPLSRMGLPELAQMENRVLGSDLIIDFKGNEESLTNHSSGWLIATADFSRRRRERRFKNNLTSVGHF